MTAASVRLCAGPQSAGRQRGAGQIGAAAAGAAWRGAEPPQCISRLYSLPQFFDCSLQLVNCFQAQQQLICATDRTLQWSRLPRIAAAVSAIPAHTVSPQRYLATGHITTGSAEFVQGALGPRQRAFIASMSTFFIATSACDASAPASACGCDLSHRGGGFSKQLCGGGRPLSMQLSSHT